MTDKPSALKKSPQSSNPDEICSAELPPSPVKSTPSRTVSHDKVVSVNDHRDHLDNHDKDHYLHDIHDTGQKSNLHVYSKMIVLFIGWLIFTALLTRKEEKKLTMKGLAIDAGETKAYYLKGLPMSNHMIISVEGAFTTKPWTNETERYLTIFAEHFKKAELEGLDYGLKIDPPEVIFAQLFKLFVVYQHLILRESNFLN